MDSDWSHWDYSEDDHYLIEQWARAHGSNPLRPEWLSDTGFVLCNPKASVVCFLYHDPSCRIGFIDHVCARPDIRLGELKEAIIYLMNGPLRTACGYCNIESVLVRAPLAIARVLTHTPGWFVNERELASVIYFYEESCEAL